MRSTASPGRTPSPRWAFARPCRAVRPEMGRAADVTGSSPSGRCTIRVTGTTASSAQDPSAVPRTRSPTAYPVTPGPMAATVPETSRPTTGKRGARMPT